jgi:glycosyltransferase involved in cell wall biosynthesis
MMNCENHNQGDKLKVLIAAPLPPPDHGGIVNWGRIIRREFEKNPTITLKFIDTTPRYRAVTNRSLAIRLVGGSAQAIRDTYRVYRQMKGNRPNLLHLCTSGGPASLKDVLILRIAKWFRVPSIIHYRMGRLPDIIERAGVEWKLTRQAMRLADVVIPLDRNSEECIKAALPDVNVVKLPNTVEIDEIDRICKEAPAPLDCPKGCTRLIFAGHVIPTKGLWELVTACVRLSDSRLALDIIGPASPGFQKSLEKIASQMRNGEWLRILGPVEHEKAVRYIAAADLFVLPSYSEGMPNVVLEAMACGQTILSTTVGAVPEMLDIGGPDECGVCVPPRNVDALADAIRTLVNNPQQCEQMGRKARQRAEQLYSVPVSCQQLVELWRTLIK